MFRRRKQEEWWQHPGEEQNAVMAEAPADEAVQPDTATAADAAAETPAGKAGKTGRKKKKSRWDWWDAAGDILEVVLDFVAELFD